MENEKNHIFEVYKIYIQTAENVSERRLRSNSFYLTLCSALITILVVVTKFKITIDYVFVVDLIGGIISAIWFSNIMSYRRLNSAKYKVIHELEKELSVKCL